MQSPLANQQDFAAGLLCLAIGIFGLSWSFSYNIGTLLRMGPGFFPALVFGALILVGLVIVARALLQPGEAIEPLALRPLALVLGAVLVFGLGVERLGFVVSAFLLVLVACFAGARLSAVQMALLAAGLTAFCWFIFVFALGLPLPLWPEALS
jgi:hypothetical protein